MSRPLAPRGPLPGRVYWVRRAMVGGTALLLVVAIARLLGAFGGSDDQGPRAVVVAQQVGPAGPKRVPGVVLTPKDEGGSGASTSGPLSEPTGPCDDSTVAVQPVVTDVPGGRTVGLTLALSTTGDTCTWRVSSTSLVVKLTAGSRKLWSTQDCPKAIKRAQVVVRPAAEPATKIAVRWSGQRSVPGCEIGQAWVRPGTYDLVAASLGGEPADVALQVSVPKRPVITRSPKPTAAPTARSTTKASD